MEEPKKHNSFIVYLNTNAFIKHLSDENAGKLFKSLFMFAIDGTETEFDDYMTRACYEVMTDAISINHEKWLRACEKKSKAALARESRKREQSRAELSTTLHTCAEQCTVSTDKDMGKDSVKGIGMDSVNDSDSDSESGRGVEMGKGSRGNPAYSKEEQEMIDAWNRKRQSVNIKYD